MSIIKTNIFTVIVLGTYKRPNVRTRIPTSSKNYFRRTILPCLNIPSTNFVQETGVAKITDFNFAIVIVKLRDVN